VGTDAAYSEFPAWHLLGRLVESVTGRPVGAHLRDAVLGPLGMTDTFVGMTSEEHRANLGRLGVNLDMAGRVPMPLLLERSERMCTEVNVAHGGYSTAADLVRFYGALDDRLLGRDAPGAVPSASTLRTFTTVARPPAFDQVLDRECGYGLGFMTGLHEHAFGSSPSAEAFGHSGMAGASFAWADPAHDLAVGVVLNGVVDPASAFLRRPALVRAIYADLAEIEGGDVDGGAQPDAEPVDAGGGGRRHRWGRRR
jgi:CubicO group peptidase (beta-lactamase class C family)